MKWTSKHDIKLGRETLLLELWKYKSGSREKCQCLDKIAENLNQIKELYFNVNQKSVLVRLKVLERAFKKKKRSEKNAGGISPEEREFDTIVEEQEKDFDQVSSESHEKAEKEKTSAETMRNMAMQRLSETKIVAKIVLRRRRSQVEMTQYIIHKIRHQKIMKSKHKQMLKYKHNEGMAKQSELLLQRQQDIMTNFQQQLASQQKHAIRADDANANDANAATTTTESIFINNYC